MTVLPLSTTSTAGDCHEAEHELPLLNSRLSTIV
jgi:hypothetical protein